VRVVLAPDGFGATLTARAAAGAMAAGWASVAPRDELVLVPLSDGGPGLVEVVAAARPAASVEHLVVEDPLARPVRAAWLHDGDTAWVESAQACGLHLLDAAERDPLRTTTYGVGQLVLAALDAGARRVVVGLGGSATNDGGAGLLAALGVGRQDERGQRLEAGGAALARCAGLVGVPDSRLAGVRLVAATDVDAPLLGLRGASAVFGPQKGASADGVQRLDAALTIWADRLEAHLGVEVRNGPGAGAAGGLGAALLALGARREPGLALVAGAVGLAEAVAGADLVVTGEGRYDATSLQAKVVGGVAALAAEHAVPCVVVAGQVQVGRREAAAAGVGDTWSLEDAVGLSAALAEPAQALAHVTARAARQWSR
jgi:glycerate kinase